MGGKILFKLLILYLSVHTLHANSSGAEHRISVQVLGSGGPELDDQRASSGYLIWVDGKAKVLVDAGGGSSLNFEKSDARFNDLEAMVFTHLHVDHSADLPAYIKASFFASRRRNLPVYGPRGNQLMPSTSEFVQKLLGEIGAFRYLKDTVDTSAKSEYHIQTFDVPLGQHQVQTYRLTDSISLSAIPVHHGPVAAIAWRVNVFDSSITFSGDMSNRFQTLATLAKGTDILLMHNAIPEAASGVAARLHMRPSEIGKIAQSADAKKVVLSHRMQRTLGKERETMRYVRENYSGPINFANDLDLFVLE